MTDDLYRRILGCVVGSAIGDAFGGIVEFQPLEGMRRVAGMEGVDKSLPYAQDHSPNPLGVRERQAAQAAPEPPGNGR